MPPELGLIAGLTAYRMNETMCLDSLAPKLRSGHPRSLATPNWHGISPGITSGHIAIRSILLLSMQKIEQGTGKVEAMVV
jgi:hypothetical protein